MQETIKNGGDYQEYSLQLCGRPLGLGIEKCDDRSLRISLSIGLQEGEGLSGEEVDVAIKSDTGNAFNCIWRNVDSGTLPQIDMGPNSFAFSAFTFTPVDDQESAAAIYILIRENSFVLDLKNAEVLESEEQTYFTEEQLREIEKQSSSG